MKKLDLVIVPCPDYKSFPDPPKDQSKCIKLPCNECDGFMWVSDKKRKLIAHAAVIGREILVACYPCILKKADEMKESGELDFSTDVRMINI